MERRQVDAHRRLLLSAGALAPLTASGCDRRKPADQIGGVPVKTWLKRPGSGSFVIPDDYLGMHTDNGSNPRTAAPTYHYDAVRTVDAAAARESNETAKREILGAGTLGLDLYKMREPLQKAGLRYID